MQTDTTIRTDRTRILASIFWIGGAVLSLVAALDSYREDCRQLNKN